MMLIEKIDTSVNSVMTRTTVNAPMIATPPISRGVVAASTLPNTNTSSTSRIGIEIISARAMSSETWPFTSRKIALGPPTLVVRPAAFRSSRTARMVSVSGSSTNRIPRYVECLSFEIRLGAGVS